MRTMQAGKYFEFGVRFAWDNIERNVGKDITDVYEEVLILVRPIHYISADMPASPSCIETQMENDQINKEKPWLESSFQRRLRLF